ncbi:MAG TPA: class I SAM-dependent methyltransferase [Acidobacteriaceae bacterium]|jgi:cyclopropane-fatty-acyl-phospholipid synthase|nr:class I SAM-dependent methyltransferase [Acidobacteriaceae bacterium]
MSHEALEPGRSTFYKVPVRPSDALRALEFTAFFRDYRGTAFSVRTLDGWSWSSSTLRTPAFVATFRSRDRLDAVTGDATEATLGRIFLDGDLDLQGDLFALLSVAEYTLRHSEGLSGSLIQTLGRLSMEFSRRIRPGRRHGVLSSWHCVPCPTDLPVQFFESWLGSLLAHSCALFREPDEDFLSAQRNALERACAFLTLERGDRLLDVACGWGSLLLYAAQSRQAEVLGIASSEHQAEVAAERIGRSGLLRRCSVEHRDLRAAPYRAECFDKIADIGIFEQVKPSGLGGYLASMQNLLVPGGLLLLHRMTSARSAGAPALRSLDPDLVFQPLSAEIASAESAGLDVVAVESLAHDYEQTLRVWIDRLRQGWMRDKMRDKSVAHDRGRRAWLLYLVETATNLQTGDLQVHRLLLRRPVCRRGATLPFRASWPMRNRLSSAQ